MDDAVLGTDVVLVLRRGAGQWHEELPGPGHCRERLREGALPPDDDPRHADGHSPAAGSSIHRGWYADEPEQGVQHDGTHRRSAATSLPHCHRHDLGRLHCQECRRSLHCPAEICRQRPDNRIVERRGPALDIRLYVSHPDWQPDHHCTDIHHHSSPGLCPGQHSVVPPPPGTAAQARQLRLELRQADSDEGHRLLLYPDNQLPRHFRKLQPVYHAVCRPGSRHHV